jgi:DNA-binding beta-propeller fold protein YncE
MPCGLRRLGRASLAVLCAWAGEAPAAGPTYRSPFDMALSPDGKWLGVSDRTAASACVVDAASGAVARTVPLNGQPTGVAWTPAGRLLVAEYDARTVAEIDPASGAVARRVAVGPKAIGLAVAPRAGLLLTCEHGLNQVIVSDLASGREKARVGVLRQPYFVAVTPDESLAVVGNLLPEGASVSPASAAALSLVDLAAMKKVADVRLPAGSTNVRAIRVSPDGRWAYVVHTIGRVALPTTQLERGWVNTDALSFVDLRTKERFATVLLDTISEGAADPWGVALSADGATAWITLAGVHQVARIDLKTLHGLMEGQPAKDLGPVEAHSGSAAELWSQIQKDPSAREKLSYHLAALVGAGLMERRSVPAQCPRAAVLSRDGRRLFVASYYTGEILALDPDTCAVAATIALGAQPAPDDARRGEIVFFDAHRCFQHWLSCGTCHPDGRADGVNWDLLNDGIGNPKNTRSLVWSHQTPPSMSLGVRESYEVAIQKGFQFIQFYQASQEEMDQVAAYMRSLEPEASPYLVPGADGRLALSPEAEKGREIFMDATVGCAACHPAPLYTDLKLYDVDTRGPLDKPDHTKFDNPTLIEMWRTGPFLHDGQAATLTDVLKALNPRDRHGRTSALNDEQIRALAAYLLSL